MVWYIIYSEFICFGMVLDQKTIHILLAPKLSIQFVWIYIL